MERVIVGRFRNPEKATQAADEVKARHLSVVEPVLMQSNEPLVFFDSSASLHTQQNRLDKIALGVALLFAAIGTVAMLLLGHIGKAAVHLPMIFALWGMTVCYALWETYQLVRIPRTQALLSGGEFNNSTDVIVTTEDPVTVEDMLADAGADEVAIRAA
jgi:hypothetical protein